MPLLPALLLTAQADRVEIPLRFRRPSALLAEPNPLTAHLVADDARSVVAVSGSPAEVRSARDYLRLLDVPRKTVRVRLTVTSPTDHLNWEVDARVASGARWRTADDETGTEVAIEPRLQPNGTIVVALIARCGEGGSTSRLRLRKGQARTLELGKHVVPDDPTGADGPSSAAPAGVALPSITLRYLGR